MELNEIVTVICSGMEYIGRYQSSPAQTSVTLNKPVMVMATEQGMGFAGSVAMTGEENPSSITLNGYTLITKTNEPVANAYRQHTSGLVLPQGGKLVI